MSGDSFKYKDNAYKNQILAMNFSIIRLFLLLSVGYELALNQYLTLEQSESGILSEIIAKYLTKYIDDERKFVSIVLTPTKTDQQHYFHKDFINRLFSNDLLINFTHNILNNEKSTSCDQRNAFNLILIDDAQFLA